MPLLLCSGIVVFGQKNEEVMRPIRLLFDGMEKADTSLINLAFDKDAKMFTGYTNKKGEEVVHEGSLMEFITTIANKSKDTPKWVEKIYNTEVKVDGNIAQVWTEYSFYVGQQFIHCGVDAFQLINKAGEWKILHIMDTRRKERCKED
ncbi:MAG: nuclear transport factor 2 family protein [Flavobacteriales bacterium]|nr:nuclear transport factor 2 family protein [Flavobacteriales bacterium]